MRADIIFLACSCFLPVIFGEVEKNETTFVPTREWQTVKKGTPIPAGLHIRHNFETGVTEAKLMDNEETEDENSDATSNHSNSKSLTLHPEKAVLDSESEDAAGAPKKTEPLSYSIDELKARLKKLKQDEAEASAELNLQDETTQTNVKQKFRDYETLKKELKALEINITTDSDLLSNYFEKFQSHKTGIIMGTLTTPDIEEVLDILYNLEYLLHHVDNAMVFADMQGMTKIISPCLNGTNNEIKAEALRLLGAAVQSNPKVQMKALQTDFVQTILHILSTNSKVELKSRCLFALSALIRQFPVAQKVWIDHGGLQIFGKILIEDQIPIQIKVMKLINDLLVERQNIREITDTEQRQQRTKAYAVTDIEKKLLIYEYCNHLTNLMTKSFQHEFSNDFRSENYEFLEVVSESMITIAPICKSEFGKNKNLLFSILRHLLNFYQNLDISQEPEQEQDENEVVRNLTSLIEILQTTVSDIPHEEL